MAHSLKRKVLMATLAIVTFFLFLTVMQPDINTRDTKDIIPATGQMMLRAPKPALPDAIPADEDMDDFLDRLYPLSKGQLHHRIYTSEKDSFDLNYKIFAPLSFNPSSHLPIVLLLDPLWLSAKPHQVNNAVMASLPGLLQLEPDVATKFPYLLVVPEGTSAPVSEEAYGKSINSLITLLHAEFGGVVQLILDAKASTTYSCDDLLPSVVWTLLTQHPDPKVVHSILVSGSDILSIEPINCGHDHDDTSISHTHIWTLPPDLSSSTAPHSSSITSPTVPTRKSDADADVTPVLTTECKKALRPIQKADSGVKNPDTPSQSSRHNHALMSVLELLYASECRGLVYDWLGRSS